VNLQWYAGLGALVGTDWANLGNNARNREEFTVDPLGHVARRRISRDQHDARPDGVDHPVRTYQETINNNTIRVRVFEDPRSNLRVEAAWIP
jgi:hypothetical protein